MGQLALEAVWKIRLALRAKAAQLWTEGEKRWAEGSRLWTEGEKRDNLWAEGDKLRADAARLWTEGEKRWAEAILAVRGKITLTWEWIGAKGDSRCILETGEVFEP